MTDKLPQTGYPEFERPSDHTPKPSVIDVAVEKPETRVEIMPDAADDIDGIRKSVRKALRYALAAAGALIITTTGQSNPSDSLEKTSASGDTAPALVETVNASNREVKIPDSWQMFNMGHDNRTFNIDVKYPEPLTYRIEDLSDPQNFKEITTVIEEGAKKVRAVIKLDKATSEGVRYSVRLAEDPDQKPEGLQSDGIAPLPKNPLE